MLASSRSFLVVHYSNYDFRFTILEFGFSSIPLAPHQSIRTTLYEQLNTDFQRITLNAKR